MSDPESVFELIRKNVDKTRVHTFGIGSGASEQLVKGAAEAGKGGYNFTEGGKITEKVISSLSKGAQPLLTQFSLNFPDTINILHQIPRNASQSVYRNEPFNIFAIFETKSKTEELGVLDGVNLSAFDNYTQSPIQFKLEQGEVVEGEGLFNICVRKLLVKDESLKVKDKVKLSQKYSILCEETAFFAEEKRISEVKTELEVIKVPVAICKTTRRPVYDPYMMMQCCCIPMNAMDMTTSYIPSMKSKRVRRFNRPEKSYMPPFQGGGIFSESPFSTNDVHESVIYTFILYIYIYIQKENYCSMINPHYIFIN